jgi:hypothetical protein
MYDLPRSIVLGEGGHGGGCQVRDEKPVSQGNKLVWSKTRVKYRRIMLEYTKSMPWLCQNAMRCLLAAAVSENDSRPVTNVEKFLQLLHPRT